MWLVLARWCKHDPIQVHIVRISANESLCFIAKKDKVSYSLCSVLWWNRWTWYTNVKCMQILCFITVSMSNHSFWDFGKWLWVGHISQPAQILHFAWHLHTPSTIRLRWSQGVTTDNFSESKFTLIVVFFYENKVWPDIVWRQNSLRNDLTDNFP